MDLGKSHRRSPLITAPCVASVDSSYPSVYERISWDSQGILRQAGVQINYLG